MTKERTVRRASVAFSLSHSVRVQILIGSSLLEIPVGSLRSIVSRARPFRTNDSWYRTIERQIKERW
jgi:hypothetical protein